MIELPLTFAQGIEVIFSVNAGSGTCTRTQGEPAPVSRTGASANFAIPARPRSRGSDDSALVGLEPSPPALSPVLIGLYRIIVVVYCAVVERFRSRGKR